MALYYFDTHTRDQSVRDDEGNEFESPDAAMKAAARSAAEIGTHEVMTGDPDGIVVVVDVRDEQNERVCSVTAAMTIDWIAQRS